MQKTKVFKSGNSMAVRLPKGFELKGDEVEILRKDDEIVIREIPKTLGEAFELFESMPDDFFADGRDDPPPAPREPIEFD